MAEKEKVKIPPNSKESEMMVLGCMLTNVNSLNIGADNLKPFDFYYTEHQEIFKIMQEAFRKDRPADVHIIAEDLKKIDKLDVIGGVPYLTTLAQYAGTSAFIEEYVDIVKNKAILREMINISQQIEKGAFEEPKDVSQALDIAQNSFFQISQTINGKDFYQIKDLLSGVKSESQLPYLKELQERQEKFQLKGPDEPKITGIPTHFLDLDKLIDGVSNSNLIILAARPAMGKTALALNIAENIAIKNSLPVGIFSLEMSAEQVLHRIICSLSEVESEKIKTGSLNGSEYQKVVASVNTLMRKTVVIDDQPGLKITDLKARARRMKEAFDIQFLAIDYLQLISGSGSIKGIESRQMEISEISRLLKNLARELNIPVLCLSQLSRKVEERQGHRPVMSDLRESGCLAGDTVIVDANTEKKYSLKELAENRNLLPITVYGIDENYKIGKYKMSKAFYSGKKQLFLLKTKSGRSIKASANHPFLKWDGWTRLDNLKPHDKIGLSRQDYHYTSLENIDIVKDAPDSLFKIKSTPIRLSHNKFPRIANWFNNLEIERVSSYQKRIPEQPQHLLLYVPSSLAVSRSAKGYRNMYRARVQGSENQIVFLNKIGCVGKKKELIPNSLDNLQKIIPNPNNDIISNEAWKLVENAKNKARVSWRALCEKLNMSYCGSTLFKSGISRNRMLKLYHILKDKKLLTLAHSDLYWDEIVSIEPLSVENVYDATIDQAHNFLANDIFVHNSIEQESDQIIFILRREYYDPYDKPGQAELIVAKNRHGSVGSANLTFRKELAKFDNLLIHAPLPDNDDAFANFS